MWVNHIFKLGVGVYNNLMKFHSIAGALVEGLSENNLDHYTHLLTGYIGSASFLRRIVQLVQDLKRKNPKLVYGEQQFQIVPFHI